MKLWREIAESAGFDLDGAQVELLETYRDWLRSEAIPAGGLGPSEGPILNERHIADSLLFSHPFTAAPSRLADLGAGVGLPGIPLAILWPATIVTLIDRSAKRVDLARRVVRVLGLENVGTIISDFVDLEDQFPAIVSRATVPPEQLANIVRTSLSAGGIGVVGGSWITPPVVSDWETVEIPVEMLDRAVWLLIMRRE